MTEKQIKTLAIVVVSTMTSDYLTSDQKLARYKEIMAWLDKARDLYIMDNKALKKAQDRLYEVAMEAYNEYNRRKEA